MVGRSISLGRMTDELPSSIIAGISFVGRGEGQVKTLGGFKKGRHTLPDTVNATTNAFLGKICEGELTAQAEKLFQSVRVALGYKRKEITLSVSSPGAVMTTKDFVVEIAYTLEEAVPSRYVVATVLHSLRNAELARTEEFNRIFGGAFTELAFALKKGVGVEAVIDLIEGLGSAAGLEVSYPSDYRECVISVEGVDAKVRCTGISLEMVFPHAGSPRDLMDGFAGVRGAFAVSRELAGILA